MVLTVCSCEEYKAASCQDKLQLCLCCVFGCGCGGRGVRGPYTFQELLYLFFNEHTRLLFQMHLSWLYIHAEPVGSCLWKECFHSSVCAMDFLTETTGIEVVFLTNNNQTCGSRVLSMEIFRDVSMGAIFCALI